MTSFTVIGDLVGSRRAADRARLHATLGQALAAVNEQLAPPTPLRVTVGDEYQGVLASLGDALRATLLLRVALLPDVDVRHGIGCGEVTVLAEEPRVEDGPGWWSARDAIVAVAEAEQRPGTRSLRTAYDARDDQDGRAGAVNAALTLRDAMVGGLSERSLSVLRGLLGGETQRDIAARLDVSASAVSQRVRGDGLAAIVAAHDLMGAVT